MGWEGARPELPRPAAPHRQPGPPALHDSGDDIN